MFAYHRCPFFICFVNYYMVMTSYCYLGFAQINTMMPYLLWSSNILLFWFVFLEINLEKIALKISTEKVSFISKYMKNLRIWAIYDFLRRNLLNLFYYLMSFLRRHHQRYLFSDSHKLYVFNQKYSKVSISVKESKHMIYTVQGSKLHDFNNQVFISNFA